jgi:hypothetical protein
MKVKELIEELQKYDGELELFYRWEEIYNITEIQNIEYYKDDGFWEIEEYSYGYDETIHEKKKGIVLQ